MKRLRTKLSEIIQKLRGDGWRGSESKDRDLNGRFHHNVQCLKSNTNADQQKLTRFGQASWQQPLMLLAFSCSGREIMVSTSVASSLAEIWRRCLSTSAEGSPARWRQWEEGGHMKKYSGVSKFHVRLQVPLDRSS